MTRTSVPSFPERLRAASSSAFHLEMRDSYTPSDPTYLSWTRGEQVDALDAYGPWVELVSEAVSRGITVRRARIVSEPVTAYIRFEHSVTHMNLAAGEEVRWLPRRQASDIALPGNDFWLLDGALVRFGHFSGDGEVLSEEWTEDPAVAKLCDTAFASVWERGIPHAEYKV
ncbi:DUF6879 family protein [Streptomyces sp. NPDC088789]|uniref:DUF6879 family protein n=1 Tax=Streptomyces sp. NPDC088789 TaxID=3365899 RepID=UPI00382CB093